MSSSTAVLNHLDVIARKLKTDLVKALPQAQILLLVKSADREARDHVKAALDESGLHGLEAAELLSGFTDQLLTTLFSYAESRFEVPGQQQLTLVAVGGYGRGQLAPFSDLDLLFLVKRKALKETAEAIEFMLYLLWDCGFKVGQSTRTVAECIEYAEADLTVKTSLLEARRIAGSEGHYTQLKKKFRSANAPRKASIFIEGKLGERALRHEKTGISRYSLEPNIKEGKGGLRDLQTLFWIARYLYGGPDRELLVKHGVFTLAQGAQFKKAEIFLWTLRFHLHYVARRAEERLTFDLQEEVAQRMQYKDHAGTLAVERLMKRYFLVAKDVGDFTRILIAALEADQTTSSLTELPRRLLGRKSVEGFPIDNGRLSLRHAKDVSENPINLLKIFAVAQKNSMSIHPRALRVITQNIRRIDREFQTNAEANALFLSMLCSKKDPAKTLRRMSEAGVLGRFIPDFARVIGQMQFDRYHHYTVDEHTIFAVDNLHRIEHGTLDNESPLSAKLFPLILSRRALYVAVFLHDIAKGRGGDHSILGAEVAKRLCPRFGLSHQETDTVSWLILNHLQMSKVAFNRDLDDPQTVENFAELVQSVERLRLLHILTGADIRAVGPGVWNGWKVSLLREIHRKTELSLNGGLTGEARAMLVKDRLTQLREELTTWSAEKVKSHVALGYDGYWLAYEIPSLAAHAELIKSGDGQKVKVDFRMNQDRAYTKVTVYTADQPGLFAKLAGSIALAGGTIDSARIHTLKNSMALDTFVIRDAYGGSFDRPEQLHLLENTMQKVLFGGEQALEKLHGRRSHLPRRMDVFRVTAGVLFDNKSSRSHTVVEVSGRDRPGVLYAITSTLHAMDLTVSSAKITNFGTRFVDSFYVGDTEGVKIRDNERLEEIKAAILKALAQTTG